MITIPDRMGIGIADELTCHRQFPPVTIEFGLHEDMVRLATGASNWIGEWAIYRTINRQTLFALPILWAT